MTDFSRIINGLNSEEEAVARNVNITVIALGGNSTKEVEAGITVGTFKSRYGLEGTKLVNEEGDTLDNSAVLTSDMQVFVSAPKKNG